MSAPTYLYVQSNRFYYRRRIPTLSTCKSPLMVSLGTKNKNQALIWSLSLTKEFETVLNSFAFIHDPIPDALVHKFLQRRLKQFVDDLILDLHSRRVIGWAVSNRMKRDLAIRALKMAIAFRQPPKDCIHHTDRGSQYCSHDYHKILRQHGFKVSISGKGNCYDNAAVETFFKTPSRDIAAQYPAGQ